MDENKLLEACFELAENLMWEKKTAPIEKLPEQITELSEMTKQFVEIAKGNYYMIEELPEANEILIGAIKYLNTQAITPLRGNYNWFFNSLSALLEICNPNSIVDQSNISFLLALQKGLINHIDLSIRKADDNDLD